MARRLGVRSTAPGVVAPNHLQRQFRVDAPNQVWVTDITYIRAHEGWLYLAVVLDLFSRQIVGWSMGDRMTRELAINALLASVWRRKPKDQVLVHSDRGSQFSSHDWQDFPAAHRLRPSMSRRGNCYDSAVAESFFQLLKRERIRRKIYHTRDQARADVFDYIELFYELITPSGRKLRPAKGRCWYYTEDKMQEAIADNRIWFGESGNNVPAVKRFLSEVKQGVTAKTIWFRGAVGDNQEAKKEALSLNGEHVFSTPKPERLIKRVLELATQEGDLVLDSFFGSGTTAAVAHKMNRRYIGIELGEHVKTHCAVHLQKVIAGEQGGISKSVNWQGDGGFKFYTLGAELFTHEGKIHPEMTFSDLAAYLCFFETCTPYQGKSDSPLLGIHNNTAIYLLYNGILKDKSATGGNILSAMLLRHLPAINDKPDVKKVVYALGCRLSSVTLAAQNIHYRHIPYQVPSEERNSRRKISV